MLSWTFLSRVMLYPFNFFWGSRPIISILLQTSRASLTPYIPCSAICSFPMELRCTVCYGHEWQIGLVGPKAYWKNSTEKTKDQLEVTTNKVADRAPVFVVSFHWFFVYSVPFFQYAIDTLGVKLTTPPVSTHFGHPAPTLVHVSDSGHDSDALWRCRTRPFGTYC